MLKMPGSAVYKLAQEGKFPTHDVVWRQGRQESLGRFREILPSVHAEQWRILALRQIPNGRSMDEVMRLLVAMQTSDKHGIDTPANWQPGDDVIVPPPGSCGAAKRSHTDDVTVLDWFMCLKNAPRINNRCPTRRLLDGDSVALHPRQ